MICVRVRQGVARQLVVGPGVAGHGAARLGMARQGKDIKDDRKRFLYSAGLVVAWQGPARQGKEVIR